MNIELSGNSERNAVSRTEILYSNIPEKDDCFCAITSAGQENTKIISIQALKIDLKPESRYCLFICLVFNVQNELSYKTAKIIASKTKINSIPKSSNVKIMKSRLTSAYYIIFVSELNIYEKRHNAFNQ